MRLVSCVPYSIGDEEIVELDRANSVRRGDVDLGAQSHEDRRCIGGVRRHTAGAAFDDVAYIAILLQAETQGLTPEVGLVVVGAPCIEADVTAKRPLIADFSMSSNQLLIRYSQKFQDYQNL